MLIETFCRSSTSQYSIAHQSTYTYRDWHCDTMLTLPVYAHHKEILQHIHANRTTVLIGETGSGKSTQLPQFLLREYRVAVTQPRRVAAINLATRVAHEQRTPLGHTVGYSVRFDHRAGRHTRCKYLTDGMLLRELLHDGLLSQYDIVVIDEAHERTVLTDLILGFLKELQHGPRPELRVVIMSATLSADTFSAFFDDCPVLHVRGRRFPVTQLYLRGDCDDVVDTAVRCCVQINAGEPLGDVLCFLPGQEEIDKAVAVVAQVAGELQRLGHPLMVALPLYASLPPDQQAKVFQPLRKPLQQAKRKGPLRKVVLCTNVAETSVTVPGVRYVVDSGLRKVKVWRHALNLSTLLTVPVSQASAQQRAGRAGREAPGKCFRLYMESDLALMPPLTEPEIARCDVTAPLLLLKRCGVEDVVRWSWFEHPGRESVVAGLGELYALGALDSAGHITPLGERMSQLPLAPQLSAVLLAAEELGCLGAALEIVAALSVENLLLNAPPEKRDEVNERRAALCHHAQHWGDLVMCKELLDCYADVPRDERREWCSELYVNHRAIREVAKVRGQLRRFFGECASGADPEDEGGAGSGAAGPAAHTPQAKLSSEQIPLLLQSFLKGFPRNVAVSHPDRSYRTATTGESVVPHPASTLFARRNCPAILYTEYVYTSRGYARNVSRLELAWLA